MTGKVEGMKQKKTKWKDFLENISVLQWILTFLLLGLACIGLMVYLMFTSLWPLPTLYFIWQLKDWHTPERGGRRTAFVRNWKMWKHVRDYFPMKLVKTAELNPNKNYILGCHPHGVMSMGAFTSFSTEACGFMDLFPGVRSCLCILGGIFKVPLYREYAMATGCYPVSRPSLEHLLSKSGKGNAVVIVIGGAAESLLSLPGVNTVYMKQRKGFVRVALEFGADLVPVYSYGENNIFRQVIFTEDSVGWRLQQLFKKLMGFAPCLFVGECWFWMPYHCPVTTVVGSPIPVPKRPSPTQEEVDHYHGLYMEALSKLFHGHKASCGLSDSHELRII
ncbi:diacylglycerol O-acyltransferase 2 [Oncorhynchus mykiss]|uniref:Acyltransferase n=1 Tax=Oncorhynchus mykiss TaxID=8022 RepID=A0A8C7U2K9_ONCMY|nr:diacylglycerol O-acyltransferase 2 [Oncorhynchus mykiss]